MSEKWAISGACIYEWIRELVLQGVGRLKYQRKGGRQAKLTPSQKQELCNYLDAGPQAAGFANGCWNSLLVQELIRREFGGVVYNRLYVCELLKNLGYSFQKAKFVSDHLDEEARRVWQAKTWPDILKAATTRNAMILFGDEASFPQWGTLSYTWARRGEQPKVKTSGIRKAYKTFGLIDYFTGRFFHHAITDKFNADSYQTFLTSVLAHTTQHLFLIQDGARYHTSKAMKQFFEMQVDRLTVYQLPSYSPDFNPIEYLWRKVKTLATHNKYFAQFEHLIHSVDTALQHFAKHAKIVKRLFRAYCLASGLALLPAP
ncbi:MAG: IS630 family transposase [Anaerolineae bacterium]|nr:IS630 family transposase [Anaerolineae bacterium]